MQKIVWRLGQIIMGYFWGIAFKIDAKMKVSFNDIIGYESQKSDLAKIIRLLELRSTSKCRLRNLYRLQRPPLNCQSIYC